MQIRETKPGAISTLGFYLSTSSRSSCLLSVGSHAVAFGSIYRMPNRATEDAMPDFTRYDLTRHIVPLCDAKLLEKLCTCVSFLYRFVRSSLL